MLVEKKNLDAAIGTTESSGLADWCAPGPYFLDAPRLTRLLESLEGSIEQELPADAGFAGNYTEQRFQTGARGAAVAMRLRAGLGAEVTPSLQAWRAIALSRQGNPTAAEWSEVLSLCQALVGSPERPPGTSAYDAELHVAHANALLHADPDGEARDRRRDATGHLWQALRLLNRFFPSGGEPRERFGRVLWDRVVGPGVELTKGLDAAAVPPAAEDTIARYDLYRAGAEILATNHLVQTSLRDRSKDFHELAVEMLATAANLARSGRQGRLPHPTRHDPLPGPAAVRFSFRQRGPQEADRAAFGSCPRDHRHG